MKHKNDTDKLKGLVNQNGFLYISIEARRWFQKSYGNTYHSCRVSIIFDSGNEYKKTEIGYNPFAYGYGSHYLNTAAEILGVSEIALREFMMENKNRRFFQESVIDVNRKKDL